MSNLLKALLAIVAVVAIGAAIYEARMTAGYREDIAYLQNQQITYSNQVAELSARLTSAKTRLTEADHNNDQLAAKVQELLKQVAATPAPAAPAETADAAPKGFAALFGGNGTNGMSAAMTKMMKSTTEQQIEGRISGLKTKLNLTPQQEAAIRDILTKESERGTELAQKMFSGEGINTNEVASAMSQTGSTDDQIKALLTPEQATAYEEFKTEEQSRNARLMANMEMMQIQNVLQLDQAQQDKVFGVLADQAMTQLSGTATNMTAALDFEGQMNRKAEALRGVLTPDQFTAYQKWQQQQLDLIKSMQQGLGK